MQLFSGKNRFCSNGFLCETQLVQLRTIFLLLRAKPETRRASYFWKHTSKWCCEVNHFDLIWIKLYIVQLFPRFLCTHPVEYHPIKRREKKKRFCSQQSRSRHATRNIQSRVQWISILFTAPLYTRGAKTFVADKINSKQFNSWRIGLWLGEYWHRATWLIGHVVSKFAERLQVSGAMCLHTTSLLQN